MATITEIINYDPDIKLILDEYVPSDIRFISY